MPDSFCAYVSKTYPNGVEAPKDVTLTIPQRCTGCSPERR